MANILAIDTSTEACSVALGCGESIFTDHRVIPRKHADTILEMVEGLLAQAQLSLQQLDAIAAGVGPGSFTGLRIATAVCQGLAYAHELPVIPVSSLQAMAWQARQQRGPGPVFCTLDARIHELYWGVFEVGPEGVTSLIEEQLSPPALVTLDVLGNNEALMATGNGLVYLNDMPASVRSLLEITDDSAVPHSTAMLALAGFALGSGQVCRAEELSPVYLRDNVARKPE